MPRTARLDFPGTLHHVIIRGIERRKIVRKTEDRKDFVARLGALSLELATPIYAWALLSNHAHILLRSGPQGVSTFMRRFLTGYATAFNRRHRRHGTLFQNRYKSILCDEESYFLELVRYIHLNPLRAGLVKSLSELDGYGYAGHSVLMGRADMSWQDTDTVLKRFGRRTGTARSAYREFVKAGVEEGRRPDLVGGGLLRSQGGWSGVISKRRQGMRELSDERILGSGVFVEGILAEAEERVRQQFSQQDRTRKMKELIQAMCRKHGVNESELRGGGRRGNLSRVRLEIAEALVEGHGVPMAHVAREVGVTTAGISRALRRK